MDKINKIYNEKMKSIVKELDEAENIKIRYKYSDSLYAMCQKIKIYEPKISTIGAKVTATMTPNSDKSEIVTSYQVIVNIGMSNCDGINNCYIFNDIDEDLRITISDDVMSKLIADFSRIGISNPRQVTKFLVSSLRKIFKGSDTNKKTKIYTLENTKIDFILLNEHTDIEHRCITKDMQVVVDSVPTSLSFLLFIPDYEKPYSWVYTKEKERLEEFKIQAIEYLNRNEIKTENGGM